MDPISIGALVAAVGGPTAIVGAVFGYGKLTGKVEALQSELIELEARLDEHVTADTNAVNQLSREIQEFKNDALVRLARIEERLTNAERVN